MNYDAIGGSIFCCCLSIHICFTKYHDTVYIYIIYEKCWCFVVVFVLPQEIPMLVVRCPSVDDDVLSSTCCGHDPIQEVPYDVVSLLTTKM